MIKRSCLWRRPMLYNIQRDPAPQLFSVRKVLMPVSLHESSLSVLTYHSSSNVAGGSPALWNICSVTVYDSIAQEVSKHMKWIIKTYNTTTEAHASQPFQLSGSAPLSQYVP
ncbi:hypothetical protein GDO81_015686 [Engystomops pustulosus]|uniref:Uncharacterized protein n=1 Tax=Engystomops pustulosus TaxID=76066 RepID=A0AAV7AMB6_ENGPU|nr:hypothetical protein GDO81_015686 [Engystomops pustulosus]